MKMNEWIPVEKEVPELNQGDPGNRYSGTILISAKKDDDFHAPFVTIGRCYEDHTAVDNFSWYDDVLDDDVCGEVTAWMPIPDPFKG